MNKLSRSKIELFLDCPRCFWLDVKHGIKRPPPAPYTINSAIDYLLKQEFDIYREKGKPHPIMVDAGIDAVPYQSEELSKWRHNFTGVQFYHQPTDFLVYGAVDDVWINPKGELIVVDYKATGANEYKVHESYPRQMEIYQWLLRQNKYPVSDAGYFVFARVDKADGFSNLPAVGQVAGRPNLTFDIFVEPLTGNPDWVEGTLRAAKAVLDLDTPPPPSEKCINPKTQREKDNAWCKYRLDAAKASKLKQ